MGPWGDRKACWDRLAGPKRRFDFENGRSFQPNDPSMLCDRLMDPFLYSFCYRLIEARLRLWRILPVSRHRYSYCKCDCGSVIVSNALTLNISSCTRKGHLEPFVSPKLIILVITVVIIVVDR